MNFNKNRAKVFHIATAVGLIAISGCTATHNAHNAQKALAVPADGGQQLAVAEGESGEQTVSLSTSDIAYLTQLGQMRGHLDVGYKLYRAGHIDHAKTHMKHPESELYAGLIPAFAHRGAPDFSTQLSAMAEAVESEQSNITVNAAYTQLLEAISRTEQYVGGASKNAAGTLDLVVELLKIAAKEYGIAVVDGKMMNPHEYQDAFGFTQVAKSLIHGMDAKQPGTAELKTRAETALSTLDPLWPGLIPPDKLTTNAQQLLSAADTIASLGQTLEP